MTNTDPLPLLDELLGHWQAQIGKDYAGYRNHCQRMAIFCLALHDACSIDDQRKIAIAACFHDVGIWSDGTIDYLPPSSRRARDYLKQAGLESWTEEIELMIDEHHKQRSYKVHPNHARYPLVEAFRKADLIDLSFGLFKFGLPASLIKSVKAQLPNEGFHKKLMSLAGGWFKQHPLSAPPFLKW